ncbi:YveK family protein [Lysinibacillus sp. Ag94]|uniref:YveK family protein n=1 Tax=Lysinibacillus sp. Ag94 TaxID=2936682 RepID=UPI00200EFFD2|nr:Wzz/FepE/Etk N-terminal domain-containing protein [Lysinibacillus sp. Ag94]UPW84251.1 Wzz/FepE/Etk N-terminal domain-containing protein [Lysinibacillus sp. Ag94]
MEEVMDLKKIFKILRKRIYLILSLTIVAIGITAALSYFVITPIYQAQTQFLVNQTVNDQEAYARAQQLETDLQLINTYNVIIKSPAILNKVIDKLDLNITTEKLAEQIIVSSERNSKVVTIKVLDTDSEKAVTISNTVATVFKEEIPKLMSVDNINILSEAKISKDSSPVKPNKLLNIVLGAVLGFVISVGFALLLEFLDTTIKTESDIEELALPVIGLVGVFPTEKNYKSRKARRA